MANHQSKINEDQVYEVDEIVEEKQGKNGIKYLLKWKGWSSKHNTWEPSEHIIDKNLITIFHKKKQQQQALQLKNKESVVKKKKISSKSIVKNTDVGASSSNNDAPHNNDVLENEDDDGDLPTMNASTNASKGKGKKRALQSKRRDAKQRKKVTIVDYNTDSDESGDELDDKKIDKLDEVLDDESDDESVKEPADEYPDEKSTSKKEGPGTFSVRLFSG